MKIIAYGSLLNEQSLGKTLKRSADIKKIYIPNYRRVFNAPFGKYSYLNLAYKQKSILEAAYFYVADNELDLFLDREAGSQLKEILQGFFAFFWPDINCRTLPVLRSYIKICEDGAKSLGIDFWQGTITPKEIIEDGSKPLYTI